MLLLSCPSTFRTPFNRDVNFTLQVTVKELWVGENDKAPEWLVLRYGDDGWMAGDGSNRRLRRRVSMPVACCVLTLCQCTWIVQPQPRAGSSYHTLAINSRVQLGEATVLAQAGVFDVQLPDAAVPERADAEESEDDAVDRCDDEGRGTGEAGRMVNL